MINYGAKLAMPAYMKEIRKGVGTYAASRYPTQLYPSFNYLTAGRR